jgi:hypothetical protein
LAIVLPMGLLDRPTIGMDFWCSMLYVRFFGYGVFHLIGFIGFGYFLFSAVAYLVCRGRRKLRASEDSSPTFQRTVARFHVARNFLGIVALYACALVVNILAVNAIMYQRPQDVAWACDLLMRADYALFGSYVPFELHNQAAFNAMIVPIINSYLHLSSVLSLVVVGLFLFRAGDFRQFVLGFVVITSLGLPSWYAIPAITPSEAYRTIKLRRDIPYQVAYEIGGPIIHLDSRLVGILNELELNQSNPEHGRYFITSFPSPHVAWGLLVVWFGVALHRRLALLLVPWGTLNAIGAIYSLEHYAVDALAGIVVVVVAVLLVRGLVGLERRNGLPAPQGYGLATFMKDDAAAFGQMLWRPIAEKMVRSRRRDEPAKR